MSAAARATAGRGTSGGRIWTGHDSRIAAERRWEGTR